MLHKRAFFCSLHSPKQDAIYVFGGNDGVEDLNLVEMYDVELDNWVQLKSMQVQRNGAQCCFMGDRWLFVMGGVN